MKRSFIKIALLAVIFSVGMLFSIFAADLASSANLHTAVKEAVGIGDVSSGICAEVDASGNLQVGGTLTATPSVVDGGVEATAQRVTIASDSTGLLSVDDNSASLTVDNGGTFAVQVPVGTGVMAASTPVTVATDDTVMSAIKTAVETSDNAISGSEMLIAGGATQSADVKVTLDSEAVVLGAGSAAVGKLAANDGVDIGDVDVATIAAGSNKIGKVEVVKANTTSIAEANGAGAGGLEVLAAGAASVKNRVYKITLTSDATSTLAISDGFGTYYAVAGVPIVLDYSTVGKLQSTAATAVTVTASGNVGALVEYSQE